jgi:hypothetical protein
MSRRALFSSNRQNALRTIAPAGAAIGFGIRPLTPDRRGDRSEAAQ